MYLGEGVDWGPLDAEIRHGCEHRGWRRRRGGHELHLVIEVPLLFRGRAQQKLHDDRRAAEVGHAVVGDGVVDRLGAHLAQADVGARSEEHTSELQSLMRISYAVFCLKKKTE